MRKVPNCRSAVLLVLTERIWQNISSENDEVNAS